MTTERLMEIVKERGLEIRWDGSEPYLFRPKDNQYATEELLKVLKFHKERIKAIHGKAPMDTSIPF